MKYINSKEIAKKWNISERSVRNYCFENRIPGCILDGKTWRIPCNAVKPSRKNRKIVKDKSLLDILREEKDAKLSGGIYHKLQIEMAYNSNHIEGSKLTHDQTRYIFETKTILVSSSPTKIDDIIETSNHFALVDYIIDNADKKLSESLIKRLHSILKQGTSDSALSWFNVGEYKRFPNEVGGKETTKPEDIRNAISELLTSYNKKTKIAVEDIIDFHQRFEIIHPFQDGNGRVGRLIILKECLKNNIVPIIIKDDFKEFYYRGLKEYDNEKGYLIDTCLHGQDIFKKYLDYFKIKY